MIWIVVVTTVVAVGAAWLFLRPRHETISVAKHRPDSVPVLEHAEMEQALAQAQTHQFSAIGRHHAGHTAEFPSVTPHGANKHFVDQTSMMPAIKPPVPRRVA